LILCGVNKKLCFQFFFSFFATVTFLQRRCLATIWGFDEQAVEATQGTSPNSGYVLKFGKGTIKRCNIFIMQRLLTANEM
jgi:hypothetical protein